MKYVVFIKQNIENTDPNEQLLSHQVAEKVSEGNGLT